MQTEQQQNDASFYQAVVAASFGKSPDSESPASTEQSGSTPHAFCLEALSDFQCLDGWWNKIIVRDMVVSQPDQCLPDLTLDFEESIPATTRTIKASQDASKGC